MIAYKATYNYKCLNQTYAVGKTYTSDKLKICHHGMHYCNKMEDTLYYYEPTKDFILLEVEILGDVETEDNKSFTNKLKVLRVVPPDEYTDRMVSEFPSYEYDDIGNMISETSPDGDKYTFEYDDIGNMISATYPSGVKYTYEYDSLGNMISATYSDGANTNPPLCIHCKYYDGGTCKRPLYDKPPSLVTGEVITVRVNDWASYERRHVGWLERLVGTKKCGAEGLYFEEK